MKDFRELDVWRRSSRLATEVYRATRQFPAAERFDLDRQMRRAAISVPSNIAEGNGRGTPRDFARFLRIAYGSTAELETQLVIAADLGFGKPDDLRRLARESEEVRRMIWALRRIVEAG